MHQQKLSRNRLLNAYIKNTRKTIAASKIQNGNYVIQSLLENLTYLRDFLVTYKDDTTVLEYISQESYDENIITLSVAVAEIRAYFNSEELFHWKNFCELFKRNMEGWLKTYDSIQACPYS